MSIEDRLTVIYLSPHCDKCRGEEELSWSDNPQHCLDCGKKGDRYLNLDSFVMDFTLFCLERGLDTSNLDDFLEEEKLDA